MFQFKNKKNGILFSNPERDAQEPWELCTARVYEAIKTNHLSATYGKQRIASSPNSDHILDTNTNTCDCIGVGERRERETVYVSVTVDFYPHLYFVFSYSLTAKIY